MYLLIMEVGGTKTEIFIRFGCGADTGKIIKLNFR